MAKTELDVRKRRGSLHKQLQDITYRNKLFFQSITGKEVEGSYQNTQKFKPPTEWAGLIDAEGNMLDTELKDKTLDMINKSEGHELKLKNMSKYLSMLEKESTNGESIQVGKKKPQNN